MSTRVAIVDYGMGNLFSVLHACEAVGIQAEITDCAMRIESADGVILPGVGAFGDAMEEIRRRSLLGALKKAAASGNPFMGICLGMQLMMEYSLEFGKHEGLGLVAGSVVRLADPLDDDGTALKIPEVGWNAIEPPAGGEERWQKSLLADVPTPEWMYFVHSYVCVPSDDTLVASVSRYGNLEYCSTFADRALFGCQYHPERSGAVGLSIYRRFAGAIAE